MHTPERRLPLPKDEWLKCATAHPGQGDALQLVEETRQIAKRLAHRQRQHRQRQRRGWPPRIHPPISKREAGWLVEHLNSVVALAWVRQSGWWEEYWQLAKARRHSRKTAA